MTSRISGRAAGYEIGVAAHDVEVWPSLERDFGGLGCALEAGTTVSGSTYRYLFVGISKNVPFLE